MLKLKIARGLKGLRPCGTARWTILLTLPTQMRRGRRSPQSMPTVRSLTSTRLREFEVFWKRQTSATFASTRLQFRGSIQAKVTIFLGWTSGTMSGVSIRKKVNGLLDRIWFLSTQKPGCYQSPWKLPSVWACVGYSWLALLGCNAPTGSVINRPSLFFKSFWNKELFSS